MEESKDVLKMVVPEVTDDIKDFPKKWRYIVMYYSQAKNGKKRKERRERREMRDERTEGRGERKRGELWGGGNENTQTKLDVE